jgi:hypothetical protein
MTGAALHKGPTKLRDCVQSRKPKLAAGVGYRLIDVTIAELIARLGQPHRPMSASWGIVLQNYFERPARLRELSMW